MTLPKSTLFPEPIGRGNGLIYLYNNNYEPIYNVTLPGNFLELEPGAKYPSNIDVHELLITQNGSIIVTANNVTQADLTSVGGPSNGWVVEGLVYEIDIATNEVLFRWGSLDHLADIPFSASLYTLGTEGFTGANQSLAFNTTFELRRRRKLQASVCECMITTTRLSRTIQFPPPPKWYTSTSTPKRPHWFVDF